MSEVIHFSRQFLNKDPHGSLAAIFVSIHDNSWTESREKKEIVHPRIAGSIKISDCSRSIELDAYMNEPEDLENVIFKFDTLIIELTKARDAYQEAAVRLLNKNKPKKKEKKK